ncbi:MAG: hypothetical protein VYA27_04310 [Verrucomicrobiota bacterium]|nr:hypothetical protein [Verrucomicrobiota bacterium]
MIRLWVPYSRQKTPKLAPGESSLSNILDQGNQQGCQPEIEECPCFNDHGASQFDNTTQLPVP